MSFSRTRGGDPCGVAACKSMSFVFPAHAGVIPKKA